MKTLRTFPPTMLKTGAVYTVEGESCFLLRCDDAETRQVSTMHLYRNSAFGMVESAGRLNDGEEAKLRELDPKRKADQKLLAQAEKALESAKARSAMMYALYKGASNA